MTNMTIERIGDLLVVVQNDIDPTDVEWEQETSLLKAGLLKRILVATAGGAPNALQRQRYTEAVGTQRVLVAVVTESRIAVAVLTCISWFVGKGEMKAYHPAEFQTALAHVGASDREVELRRVIEGMKSRLGPGSKGT